MLPMALFTLALLLFSCEASNPTLPNLDKSPGLIFDEEIIEGGEGAYTYLQKIIVDCGNYSNVEFSFRPSFLVENPVTDPERNSEGWMIFDSGTIWTDSYQQDFSFESLEGKIQNFVNGIDVQVKYPDKRIMEISSAFKSNRIIGSHLENSFLPGATLSAGIEFLLREDSGDIFVDGMYADHFMYRINIVDEDLQPIQSGAWYNSLNGPDIRKVRLSAQTEPALNINEPGTFTQFEYYVESRLGVVQADPSSIHFKVVGGYKPVACIYPQTLVGMGSYHYAFENLILDDPQGIIPSDSGLFCRQLWEDEGIYEATNSADFKLHLQWGYYGLYYIPGLNIYVNNPLTTEESHAVLNEDGENYGSRIVAHWLRLDNAVFPLLPEHDFGHQIVTDGLGLSWLRVLNIDSFSRHGILEGLSDGLHVVEVMAEDLGGELSDPVSLQFNLLPYVNPANRDEILIIDADQHNVLASPESVVDDFYTNICSDQLPLLTEIDYEDFSGIAAELSKFKTIVLHSDNPMQNFDWHDCYEALDVYLAHQGKLIISGTNQMRSSLYDLEGLSGGTEFVQNRLGLVSMAQTGILSASLIQNPYFVNAEGLNGYNDIPLNIETSFNQIVQQRQGLSTIMYFDPGLNLDWIYAFGSKAVGSDAYAPNQEDYEFYSSKYVAYNFESAGSRVVFFGFPLSYMDADAVEDTIQQIMMETRGNTFAQRRQK
jgi:hypothetical protein